MTSKVAPPQTSIDQNPAASMSGAIAAEIVGAGPRREQGLVPVAEGQVGDLQRARGRGHPCLLGLAPR